MSHCGSRPTRYEGLPASFGQIPGSAPRAVMRTRLTGCLSPVTSRHRRLLLLDSRENAVPEKNPRLQRSIDGGAAFLPTAVVVTAQLCQHLHRHGSVLF